MKFPKLKLKLKLSKLKLTSGVVGIAILIATLGLILVSISIPTTKVPEKPVPVVIVEPLPIVIVEPSPEPPLPSEPMEIVEVTVESDSGLYQGGGLHVGDIILTSAMIFNGDNQIITVEGVETEVVQRDDTLGLVALRGEKTFEILYSRLNPPVGRKVMIAGLGYYKVEIDRYMDDGDRMILTGTVPVHTVGYPVMLGIDVVGLVVGLNRMNVKQGIAVSLQGLEKFIFEMEDIE